MYILLVLKYIQSHYSHFIHAVCYYVYNTILVSYMCMYTVIKCAYYMLIHVYMYVLIIDITMPSNFADSTLSK